MLVIKSLRSDYFIENLLEPKNITGRILLLTADHSFLTCASPNHYHSFCEDILGRVGILHPENPLGGHLYIVDVHCYFDRFQLAIEDIQKNAHETHTRWRDSCTRIFSRFTSTEHLVESSHVWKQYSCWTLTSCSQF